MTTLLKNKGYTMNSSELTSLELKLMDATRQIYVLLKQFPKHEKNGLAAEIRSTLWDVQRYLVRALKKFTKKTTLQDMDVELKVLMTQLRAGYELRYISHATYAKTAETLGEAGRMLGGWIRHDKGQ